MTTYDAVVVGGRVAGASTAMLLARAGAKVLLLERSPYGTDTLSTHGLMRAGVLQLSRWGLLDHVVAAGTPPVTRTLFHYPGSSPVRISIRASQGVPALFAPRRHVLDRILVDAAAAAGVEVRHGALVTDLLADDTGRVTGIRGVDLAHGAFTARSRTTIGADGIRSTVAATVDAEVLQSTAACGALLYGYFDDFPTEGYEWAYGSSAAAGLIPTNGGQTCVFVGTTPERLRLARRSGADEAFAELFGAAAPRLRQRLEAATRVGRLRGWSGQRGHVRRSHGAGWALVGDAGYFRDPITTHGMTDALRDAELLADALLASWSGDQPEAIALGTYQAKRDALSTRLFEVSDRIAAYDWAPGEIHQLLREVSSAMSDEVGLLQSLPPRAPRRGAPATRPLETTAPSPVTTDIGGLVVADTSGVGR
jgi:2-polyprenyl-6-methoxyphenol hydroxylase-like FAD-dependent oxidoreductase